MGLRPVFARVVQTAPQQQLAEAMATPLKVLARVVPRPRQIAHRLSAGVGGCTTVNSPARPSSASLRASRRFVLMRSPGFRGINAGAMTSHAIRSVVICRCSAYPHGPAS
jgi:hypothetical protein